MGYIILILLFIIILLGLLLVAAHSVAQDDELERIDLEEELKKLREQCRECTK